MANTMDLQWDSILNNAIQRYNQKYHQHIVNLKTHQKSALKALVQGADCICSLPTGYGKSLIYEILPLLEVGSVVFVVVPLNAIQRQQVDKLGDSAYILGQSDCRRDIENLKGNYYSYIFCHPEIILNNKQLSKYFCSPEFRRTKVYVVVDEAHCVLDWGQDFRPAYKQLYQLKSILQCQILALSATITLSSRQEISNNLHMKSPAIVCASPTKGNIKLIVKTRPSPSAKGNTANTPYDFIFCPLLEKLKSQLHDFPLTIVYCNTLQWIGYGYQLARMTLGHQFYAVEGKEDTARVVMFHSSMEKDSGKLKKTILENLQKPKEDCMISLVFSSVALGMGADLKNVSQIIHAGPPSNLESYVQEIGRAGRSGCPAEATLFYNRNDIGRQCMQREMKDYCINDTDCRRHRIDEYFGDMDGQKVQQCCDICDNDVGMQP